MSNRQADSSNEITDDPVEDTSVSRVGKQSLFEGVRIGGGEQEEPCTTGGQAVLVVSGDGVIEEVLQAPDIADNAAPSSLIDSPIDELWPGDPNGRLALHVKRAIRSRRVESAEFATGANDSHYDFVFIPHGRNRVMVVARDVSERKTAFTRMEQLAYLDDTTKLPNRQYLFEELRRCTDMLRLQEGRAAVLCFDISSAEGQKRLSRLVIT